GARLGCRGCLHQHVGSIVPLSTDLDILGRWRYDRRARKVMVGGSIFAGPRFPPGSVSRSRAGRDAAGGVRDKLHTALVGPALPWVPDQRGERAQIAQSLSNLPP